jgi:hypothetical protein
VMRLLVNAGAKPSAIQSSFTVKELEKCKKKKVEAPKRPNGGLAGERERRDPQILSHLQNMYRIYLEYTSNIPQIYLKYTSTLPSNIAQIYLQIYLKYTCKYTPNILQI